VRNWSLGPISEIEAAKGDECPAGKISLLSDSWEGTFSGCYCLGALNSGTCSDTTTSCSDISAIDPIKFKYWKGVNLCGKRGPNYLELKVAKTANACGANFKPCGIIDSLKNYLCLPANQACPYNNVKYQPSSNNRSNNKLNTSSNNDIKEAAYVEIPLFPKGTEGKLIFSYSESLNNDDLKIINEFKIEDGIPCMDSEQKNLVIKPYYLENSNNSKGCTSKIGELLLDPDFAKIDSISYKTFYTENNILASLKALPLFDAEYNYLESSTSLWSKSFIGMNPKCVMKLLGNESGTSVLNNLKKSYKTHYLVKILTLSAIILTGFTLAILFFLHIVKSMAFADESGFTCTNIFEICVSSLPLLVLNIVLICNFAPISLGLELFIDPECMDRNSNMAFSEYAERIAKGNFYAFIYLLSSICGIILNGYLIIKD